MIEVNNLTRSPVNEALLKKVATTVLKKEKEEGKELSIAIVGPKIMRELNKKYRKKGTFYLSQNALFCLLISGQAYMHMMYCLSRVKCRELE